MNSCIKTNVRYSISTADLSFSSKAARNHRSFSIEVGTPPSGLIHVKVIGLLIKLCGLPSDASFQIHFLLGLINS